MRTFFFLQVCFILLLTACSRPPPIDDGTVSAMIAHRINQSVEWREGNPQEPQILCLIESILNHELTADQAIQLALLQNPKIQALFEELGISQSDVVEAGLMSNPSFEIEIRYPPSNRFHTNIEYLITSSIVDIFLIPLRTRLASTEFAQTKLRVTNEILDLAFDVRKTYYSLVAEQIKFGYLESIADLTGIYQDLLSRQFDVGNVNSLELQLGLSEFLKSTIDLEESKSELFRLKEKLNRLLGLPYDYCLQLPKKISHIKQKEIFDLSSLEMIALEKRLDLDIARLEITRINHMLGIKQPWTYTNLGLGLAGEREPEGLNVIGPGISGDLPIFNYGQAARLKLYAEWRRAQDHFEELEIQILSEVREAHKLVVNYENILNDYETRFLPLQKDIILSSEELYNVMAIGIDKLLQAKVRELISKKDYIETVKLFLAAEVDLDRALGGNLSELVIERGNQE